jgi:leader peptidase (prepilin peptidase) / N-methyltransferase
MPHYESQGECMSLLTDYFDLYPATLAGIAAVFGLLIGSFLNVAAIRVPMRESISFPPSHCVHCKHRLSPLDLVPVLSFLVLRGRCRYCKARISPIYPIGEAITAAAFGILAWQLGFTPELAPALTAAAILIAVSLSDVGYRLIPDRILLTGVILLIPLRLWSHPLPLWSYAIGAIVGFFVLYAIAWLGTLWLRKDAMGGGDIKLFAFVGLFMGWKLTLLNVFVSSVLGAVIGGMVILLARKGNQTEIPFGPFIALGAILCYLYGETVLRWYFHLVL